MLEGPQGAHAIPPAHAVHRTGPARSPRADPPAANGLGIQKDPQGAIPLRALGPGPRTAPGPHKDKKAPAQRATPIKPPRRTMPQDAERPARDDPPAVPARPTMPGGGRMRRNADRPGREATTPARRGEARRGDLPRGPLPAHAARAAPGPGRAHIEKRPPRARRPALPQPRAAVLSAKAGLTAGFGMGPGAPRLCGRARGGRSPAAQVFEPARNPCPGRPWRPHGGHGSKMAHRARCLSSRMRRARAISAARLSASPRLHLRPIDQVVYLGPYRKVDSSRRRLPA